MSDVSLAPEQMNYDIGGQWFSLALDIFMLFCIDVNASTG